MVYHELMKVLLQVLCLGSPAITIPLIWKHRPALPRVDRVVQGMAWALAVSLTSYLFLFFFFMSWG